MSLDDYLIEFNLKYHKINNLGMKLPSGVLAYFLLNGANIGQDRMEICRATCSDLTYDKMKDTIEKVGIGSSGSLTDKKTKFTSQEQSVPTLSKNLELSNLQIKQEPAFHAETSTHQYDDYDNSDEEPW